MIDCQRELGETLRVKPFTWGHGPNFESSKIWVVTDLIGSVAANGDHRDEEN